MVDIKNVGKNRKHKNIRVFTVDDHPLILEGLSTRLGRESDITVCGEAKSAAKALEDIERLKPDIVLLDLSLGDANGLVVIKKIRAKLPSLPILVLSMKEESIYAERSLRAGAQGYIMKQEASKDLLKAIRSIMQGEIFLSKLQASKLLNKVAGYKYDDVSSFIDCLTDRELEAFKLFGSGSSTKLAAKAMRVSIKTVETYRTRIKAKLGVTTASELTKLAIEWVSEMSGSG